MSLFSPSDATFAGSFERTGRTHRAGDSATPPEFMGGWRRHPASNNLLVRTLYQNLRTGETKMGFLKSLQKLLKSKPNIENLKRTHDVDGLIDALSYSSSDYNADRRFKGAIASALGELGDIRAIPPLEKVLSDLDSMTSFWQDMRVNFRGAFQLDTNQVQYKKDMDAIDATRPEVTQALKTLRLSQGGEVHNPAPSIDERVHNLVRTITTWNDARWFDDPLDQAQKELARIGKPAVEPLIAALDEQLGEYKLSYLIEPLGKIGDPRAVNVLLKLVENPSKTVHTAVVQALGGISDPRVIDPLIQALHHSDKDVRAYAAEGLGKIGSPQAVDPLIAALNDGEEYVRRCAAQSLGLLKDKRAVETLITVSVNDTIERVRESAADALKKIDPTALERTKVEIAKLAVTVSADGKALYERLHSGKDYGQENPITLVGTGARVYFRSGHTGEIDRWVLGIPTGLRGLSERRIPIDIEQNPDQAVCRLLKKSQEMQLELKAEGKIYNLIRSGDDIPADDPIIVGNLAYIFKASWDKAWHLRVPVSKEAEQDFVIPSALAASEEVDQWVLNTIAGVGVNLMSRR